MTFKQVQEYVLTFGKYKGKALADIASDDEGLRYLDWLYGEFEDTDPDLHQEAREVLSAYLYDPTVKKELERIL